MIGPLRCKGFLRGWGQRLERFARRALPAGAGTARDATLDDSQFTKTLWQALDKIEGGEALNCRRRFLDCGGMPAIYEKSSLFRPHERVTHHPGALRRRLRVRAEVNRAIHDLKPQLFPWFKGAT